MAHTLITFLEHVGLNIYSFMLYYVGIYPLFSGILLTSTALSFWLRREKTTPLQNSTYFPKVSVVVSAYNEEKYIRENLDSLCKINYPNYEIVVVNDGSTDNTELILQEYLHAGKIRLISKSKNQGKALAINDIAKCLTGEIFFMIDADADVDPEVLNYIVPHFKRARVGAVAGNPVVKNPQNFLTCMQLIEYVAIIGMIRRTHRIWGRIMAMSGVIFAIRRSAFFDVNGFTPSAATEDMDITWKLQRKFWDVLFESNAVARVVVPKTYRGLFRQRLRWSRGLMNVLNRYRNTLFTWKFRRMWPIFIDNSLSILWASCFIILSLTWLVTYLLGYKIYGIHPLPSIWGVMIATLTLVLCFTAFFIDRKYHISLMDYFFYIIYYPIYYWMLLALITVISIPALFVPPKTKITWQPER